MKCKVKVVKTMEADNNKVFRIGEDISFTIRGIRYIGEIVDIKDSGLVIKDIIMNGKPYRKNDMFFYYGGIDADSCDYSYVD